MPDFRSGLFASLQFRLALGFTLALALALVLVSLAIGLVTDRQTQRFERDRDSAQAARVKQLVSEYYGKGQTWEKNKGGLQEILEQAGPVSGSRIQIYDAKDALIADSHAYLPPGGAKLWPQPFSETKKFPVFKDGQQIGAFTITAAYAAGPELAGPAPSRISDRVNGSLVWAGIGAAALGTLLVWLLSRRALAPLQNLGATARRLGRGDLSQRAQTTGPSEIRQLAHSFNIMAAGLEEAERLRRNLTADVAHELRTPLSNIQGYLEAIKDGLIQPTPETIDTIHGQALHLSRLVEDLRLLAQAEAGALQLQISPASLDDLLQSSVEAVRPRADAKGVTLNLAPQPSLPPVELDATRIAQVIGNLLENAITHTPQGGAITVSAARAANNAVQITVSDTGHGIPSEHLPHLFDRFYRADPSRARATGGVGLGLTIARRLIEAHNGTIQAQSAPNQGTSFTLTLPITQNPE